MLVYTLCISQMLFLDHHHTSKTRRRKKFPSTPYMRFIFRLLCVQRRAKKNRKRMQRHSIMVGPYQAVYGLSCTIYVCSCSLYVQYISNLYSLSEVRAFFSVRLIYFPLALPSLLRLLFILVFIAFCARLLCRPYR